MMEMGHNGKQCAHNGTSSQNWDTTGIVHSMTRAQWDLDTMGLVHTGRDQSHAPWSHCVPVPWKWDWCTQGEISPLRPGPSVSQPHENGTQCPNVPQPHGKRTQWDWCTVGLEHTGRDQSSASWSQYVLAPWKWDTIIHIGTDAYRERLSPHVLVPICPSPMEMGHDRTCTKMDWDTDAWAQYLISFAWQSSKMQEMLLICNLSQCCM